MGSCAREATELGAAAFPAHMVRTEEIRRASAELLGANEDEIAFVKNTTEGLSFVANGLEWREGDRVVVPDREFPSTLYPWLALERRGVVVDRVPTLGRTRALPLEAFANAIQGGPPPRLVVASWVQFGRGWRTDLAGLTALAHNAGALVCIDLIQGSGVIPLDIASTGVDFAAADGHKWLLGPQGAGVFFVRGDQAQSLTPSEPGWSSVVHRAEWENLDLIWDHTARRFEGGTLSMATIHGLGAAIDVLSEAGIDRIWRHVDGLCDVLVERSRELGAEILSDRSAAGRSAIVSLGLPGCDPSQAEMDLMARGIMTAARGDALRISPHGYNDEDDIERVVAALSEVIKD